jgi:hypothetical protein
MSVLFNGCVGQPLVNSSLSNEQMECRVDSDSGHEVEVKWLFSRNNLLSEKLGPFATAEGLRL